MRIPDRWLYPKSSDEDGTERILRVWMTRRRLPEMYLALAAVLASFFVIQAIYMIASYQGTRFPAWVDAALDVGSWSTLVYAVMAWQLLGGLMPRAIFLRRLRRAGWRIEHAPDLASLAVYAHGLAIYFWRIPKAESLAAVPLDPDRYGWSFLRMLHRYQYRLHGEDADSDDRRSGLAWRLRAAVLSYCGILVLTLAGAFIVTAWRIMGRLAGG